MAREHLRAFRDVPGVRLAGIHSRTRARAEALAAEFGVALVADSVAELHAKIDELRQDLMRSIDLAARHQSANDVS